ESFKFDTATQHQKELVDDTITRVTLAHLTKRYDEGFNMLSELFIKIKKFSIPFSVSIPLDWKQCEILCYIFMGVTELRRNSWLKLNRVLVQTENSQARQQTKRYKKQIILGELHQYCNDILLMIDQHLLYWWSKLQGQEIRTFYLRIKGDLLFYLAESSRYDMKTEYMLSSLSMYNEAIERSTFDLPAYNSTLLSVYYNKAMLFIILTQEYQVARDLLCEALTKAKEQYAVEIQTVPPLDLNQQEMWPVFQRIETLLKSIDHVCHGGSCN
ncbi:unnamed protein product, partial [Didymodactylos carnosus]